MRTRPLILRLPLGVSRSNKRWYFPVSLRLTHTGPCSNQLPTVSKRHSSRFWILRCRVDTGFGGAIGTKLSLFLFLKKQVDACVTNHMDLFCLVWFRLDAVPAHVTADFVNGWASCDRETQCLLLGNLQ